MWQVVEGFWLALVLLTRRQLGYCVQLALCQANAALLLNPAKSLQLGIQLQIDAYIIDKPLQLPYIE